MGDQPQFETERLLMRALTLDDAPQIQKLVSDKRVSEMTANIPYPYLEGAAVDWISTHALYWQHRQQATFGIVIKSSDTVIGSIGLVWREPNEAELGYWVGLEYWGKGYATEAGKGIINFAFNNLAIEQIKARVLARNAASGHVLQKCGLVLTDTSAGSCGSKFESLNYYEIDNKSKP